MANKWEKLERESAKAYQAFCTYRDLPPEKRTVENLLNSLPEGFPKHSHRWYKEWSRLNDWVSRSEAHDVYVDKRILKQLERDRVRARKRHAEMGQRLALRSMQMLEKIVAGNLPPSDMLKQLHSVIRGVSEGMNAENVAYGIDKTLDTDEQSESMTTDEKLALDSILDEMNDYVEQSSDTDDGK